MNSNIELAQGQQRVTCTIGPVSLPGVLLVDGDAWLTRKEMAALFEVDQTTIDHHVARVKAKKKPSATTGKFPVTVPSDHGRTQQREVEHYNTKFVCHVGYGINGERGEEFRDWVTEVLHRDAAPESSQRAIEAAVTKRFAAVVRAERLRIAGEYLLPEVPAANTGKGRQQSYCLRVPLLLGHGVRHWLPSPLVAWSRVPTVGHRPHQRQGSRIDPACHSSFRYPTGDRGAARRLERRACLNVGQAGGQVCLPANDPE